MKKLLLTFALFFSTSILFAQNFNQPTQFNNVCDDNNDGIASFWLGEISLEILGNLNPQNYVITHHETQVDAEAGANALSSPYLNINPTPQIIFVRIVTLATQQVQYLTYQLNALSGPPAPTVTVTNCASVATSFPCWNLTSVETQIVQAPGVYAMYYQTLADAQAGINQILNPSCYISPIMAPNQPPVYYRAVFGGSGCFSIGIIELVTINCGEPCPVPTSLGVTNVTQESAVLTWDPDSNVNSWEVIVSLNGWGVESYFTSENSIAVWNLSCGTEYAFSVSANCNDGPASGYTLAFPFSTLNCPPEVGSPIDLTACSDTSSACFDLTTNDFYIIGTLDPSLFTITYHLTQADATADVAAISNPTSFCTEDGQVIYARLEDNTTQIQQTFSFALAVENYTNNVFPLSNMQQCDANNDGIITFDLTTVQAQINTTNTLEYYPGLANAQFQVDPFTNPSTFNIGAQSSITNIFVREIVTNGCDILYTFQLQAFANCNMASTCIGANSLCNSLGVPFQNTTNMNSIGTYGCLNTTPNPTWFYLPISLAGTINLQVSQTSVIGQQLDVDYIVYGPFSNLSNACNQISPNNIVSCSYSAAAIENAIIPNTQTGQYYLLMVTNFSNQSGLITIVQTNQGQVNSGEIDCSGLRLNAFLDSNNNGTKDNGEQNFPLGQFAYEINDNGNVHNIVAPTGVYNIYDTNASNSYNLSYIINPSYTASYSLTTASYSNVHVVVGAGVTTYNFPITVTQSYNDLAINIIPVTAPRPGFSYLNKIVYANNGNQPIASGTVTFNHDSLVSIIGSTQTGTTPITNGFTYNFTNLLPFEAREITVIMQVPTIPTVTIGGFLTNSASIVPLTGDVVPANNNTTNTQVIIGSYDPNDKMEAHGGRILHSTFTPNDYLTYTIRFENSGTANAENVRVNDVLDSNLDESTIRMVSASHPYIMDRVGNNINWIFDGIQLPPSVAETNIGKGFITFQVKPNAGYAIGDIIPNTASIYFDFNPAIVTNTFNTEFVAQLGVGEFENTDFVFYPNPVSDIVTIKVKNEGTIANIAVYDVSGKMIMAQKPTTNLSTQTVDLSTVSKGMYLLEVTTDSNIKVIKKLIVE